MAGHQYRDIPHRVEREKLLKEGYAFDVGMQMRAVDVCSAAVLVCLPKLNFELCEI